jgi:hypothetical protein
MQPAYAQHEVFPQSLEQVPKEALITETFAFTPGALAIGGFLALIGLLIGIVNHGIREANDILPPLGCFVGMLLFGAWEVFRRLRRVSLAFNANQIGVYRRGMLEQVAYRSQLTFYKLSIINTIRELFAFGFLGIGGFFAGIFSFGAAPETGLAILGVSVGCCGAFASSIYARVMCRHYFVPKGHGTEQVMFASSATSRFGL